MILTVNGNNSEKFLGQDKFSEKEIFQRTCGLEETAGNCGLHQAAILRPQNVFTDFLCALVCLVYDLCVVYV